MSKIIFPAALLLAFSQDIFCYDINEIKEEALKEMMANVEDLRKTINETLTQIPVASNFIYNITEHENSTAEAFANRFFNEIRGVDITASMAAHLLNSSADALECVQSITGEMTDKIKTFYADKFLTPFNEYYNQGIEIQRDNIKKWNDEYHWAISNFNVTFDAFYKDIVKSNSTAEISWLSEEFRKICWQLNDLITSITVMLSENQLELLSVMESLTDNLRRFAYEKFDVASELIPGCFTNGFIKNPKIYFHQQ